MRQLMLFMVAVLVCKQPMAQEVYLLDIGLVGQDVLVQRVRNISNNKGYDNQPSFSRNGKQLYYAATRNGQTDIRGFAIADSQYRWITATAGSEYSPTQLPGKGWLSAIKLDNDGLQRLWQFSLKKADSSLVHSDLKIGYHLWINKNELAVFVLDGPRSNSLRLLNLEKGWDSVICTKPGRSLQRIPNQKAFSYVDKSDTAVSYIKRFDLTTGVSTTICKTLKGAEDYCWTPSGNLLMALGSRLFKYNVANPTTWEVAADLSAFGIRGITRLAMQRQGLLLALVAEDGL